MYNEIYSKFKEKDTKNDIYIYIRCKIGYLLNVLLSMVIYIGLKCLK